MKVLINQEYNIAGQIIPANELIKAVMETPKAGGVNVKEMSAALKIVKDSDNVPIGGRILLEDASAAILQKEVAAFKWAVVDPVIVLFCEDVKDMKEASIQQIPSN